MEGVLPATHLVPPSVLGHALQDRDHVLAFRLPGPEAHALWPRPPSHQSPGAGAARSRRALVSSRRSTQRPAQLSPALFPGPGEAPRSEPGVPAPSC